MSLASSARSPIKIGMWLLLAPLCLWLLLLIILPHLELLTFSITDPEQGGFTFSFYAEFFTEPLYWRTFVRTALMSILATILTLLIAFPVSFFIAKMIKGRSKGIIFAMCLIPFWVSELVRTFGWMILLRESGVISNTLMWLGLTDSGVELLYTDATIMLGLVYSAMLFMVVPLVSTLDSLDDSYIEAGYDLGGNNWNIMREIIIPHAMPGIVSGCIIVFNSIRVYYCVHVVPWKLLNAGIAWR